MLRHVKSTKDGRFRLEHRQRSDDSYMSSYTSYSWSVTSADTGEEFASFSGTWDGDSKGESKSGTCHVEFSADESEVVAENYDGTVELVPLPIAFRLSEDERFLVHVHRDGHETRSALYSTHGEEFGGVLPPGLRERLEKRADERVARIKAALAKSPAR